MLLLVNGWTNPSEYSLMPICGVIGISLSNDLSRMDHVGVLNIVLPRYEYNACWEMPA